MTRIIIHGGFFTESSTDPETKKAKQEALTKIISEGYHFLQSHSAAETVAKVVELLEDDVLFNAGTGSQIQADGKVRLSAAIMNGHTRKFYGVLNIENVKNPIRVAESLASVEDRVLGGEMATAYARQKGFVDFEVRTPQRISEYQAKLKSKGLGTVGCVALDAQGNLAAATSTGGKGFEIPGRISDSGTVAGNFATRQCAVSCTGVGEDIVSVALAASICTRVADGQSLASAYDKSFAELKGIDGFAGAIAIDHQGNLYHQDSHPSMVFAAYDGITLTLFT
jgi:L-asparaginase